MQLGFDQGFIYSHSECPTPPWHLQKPLIKTQLHDVISKKDLPHLIKSEGDILIDTECSHINIDM
jgi:hypothetical protein